jgi:8-oxo-dGTP pyrophosphatase MutT (NUDIX family)
MLDILIIKRSKGEAEMKEISAGGVVYRRTAEGKLQIQLIQDRYGKVSLPKGKMETGETVEQTALREIVEETGMEGVIIAPIDQIKYQYEHEKLGLVDKEVHYYLVEAVGGSLQAQVEEIRGVDWFEPKEAWRRQKQSGYDNNHRIVAGAFQLLGLSTD